MEIEKGNNVEIGKNVIIYPGTVIGDNVIIQDGAILGKQPRGLAHSTFKVKEREPLKIAEGCLVGTNVILYAGTVIDEGTMISDGAIVREGCKIGKEVRIAKNSIVEFDCVIGNEVRVKEFAHVGEYTVIGQNTFIGPHVSMSLDKYMLRLPGEIADKIKIGKHSAIGSNSTILPGIVIGDNIIIAAGSIISKSVHDPGIYVGSPPRKVKNLRDDELK